MSASSREQCGPAMVVEKSSTRTSESGRGLALVMSFPGTSMSDEDEDDAADHQEAADPLAGGRPLLEHDV